MKKYLVAIFSSKNAITFFLNDVIFADSPTEAEEKAIGRTYYRDGDKTKILAVCRKAETVHEI